MWNKSVELGSANTAKPRYALAQRYVSWLAGRGPGTRMFPLWANRGAAGRLGGPAVSALDGRPQTGSLRGHG